MSSGPSITRVQVCLLTYKRPDLLRYTLRSLINQSMVENARLILHILVVDNDEAMSGKQVFNQVLGDSQRGCSPILSRYVCEPARGISAARNRALDESAGMDYVAFIDDDEIAHPDWLRRLLDASQRFDADVTSGPVRPLYMDAPPWVVRGGFFSPEDRPTGTAVEFVATNNVLLRGNVAAAFRFDSRFDATGGEDTELFMRVKRAGFRIVWANEAVVSECIPPARSNAAWLLSRARSDANRYTRGCLSFDSSLKTVANRFVVAAGGFLAGLALLPRGVVGRHHAVRALQLMSRSIGTMSALRGRSQIYYQPDTLEPAESNHVV